jgi:quercetin dioxygenase-like cupin family protein
MTGPAAPIAVPLGALAGGAYGYWAANKAIEGGRNAAGVDPRTPVDQLAAPPAAPIVGGGNGQRMTTAQDPRVVVPNMPALTMRPTIAPAQGQGATLPIDKHLGKVDQGQNMVYQSQERTMDPKQFARQLAEEGFDEVLTKTLPAKQQLAEHTHPFDVKALITDGQVTLGVGDKLTTYRVGDVFTMARGCEHTELYGADGVSFVVGRRHQ